MGQFKLVRKQLIGSDEKYSILLELGRMVMAKIKSKMEKYVKFGTIALLT
jgi:hypothetical protein